MSRSGFWLAVLALSAAPLILVPAISFADVAGVQNYVSVAGGDGVHVVGYSSQFPNFSGGAVDNRYPSSVVRQDATPASVGTGTYEDIGPLGQTVTADTPAQGAAPVAVAKYPGGPADAHIDDSAHNNPDSFATAHADIAKADVSSAYAGDATCSCKGATAEAHTIITPDGSLVVSVHSHSGDFSQGAGLVQVTSVDITLVVTISAVDGIAHVTKLDITGGAASVAGQPVSAGGSGVTVGPQSQPLPGVPPPPGSGDTYQIYTIAPETTIDGKGCPSGFSQCHIHVRASGTHVGVSQPASPGVPQQSTSYVLGEAEVDAVLAPAVPIPVDNGGGSTFGPPVAGYAGGPPTTFDNGAPVTTTATQPVTITPRKTGLTVQLPPIDRKPLARLFLLWETLLIAGAAAWVMARKAPAVS